MRNRNYFVLVLAAFIGCSYVNGAGDANKFAEDFAATNMRGAKSITHTCQTRDTDGNGYVSCTISVDWGRADGHPELVPIECAVNRTGSGCNNEGCRPLATLIRNGGSRQ